MQYQNGQHQDRAPGITRRNARILQAVVFCGILIWHGGTPVRGADWPHWRGPNRNDTTPEASGWRAGRSWVEAKIWRRSVGLGSTSPVIADNRVYVMGWQNGRDHVLCLDAGAGRTVWEVTYPCPRYGRFSIGDKGYYAGPSATPEFDPATGLLATLSIDGDLVCWDTARRGRRVWKTNLYDRYGVRRRPRVGSKGVRDYGWTASPLAWKDWLLVEVGAPAGSLAAFEKRTGRPVWMAEAKDPAGHTGGPVPIRVQGIPCVAVLTLRNLLVIRLDGAHAGETLARYPWVTDFGCNIPTPTVAGDCVYVTSGYNHKTLCKLRITPQGAVKVWEHRGGATVCSPVVAGDSVYLVYHALHCLAAADGRERWQGGRFGTAGSCIATGDGRIIVWGGHGRLALFDTAERSPTACVIRFMKETGPHPDVWPHVAFSNGRVFCKDRNGLLECYKVQSGGRP